MSVASRPGSRGQSAVPRPQLTPDGPQSQVCVYPRDQGSFGDTSFIITSSGDTNRVATCRGKGTTYFKTN